MNPGGNAADSVNTAAVETPPFQALLARLGRDGPAAAGYEALRQRLILFFRLHLPAHAEELADVALDRLARRIAGETEVDNLRLYALGIARKVLQEAWARQCRDHHMFEDPTLAGEAEPATGSAAVDDAIAQQAALAALQACLGALSATARQAILDYYGADGAQRIGTRQRLAAVAGISLNALRNRAQRLRDALERCVRERLAPPGPPA